MIVPALANTLPPARGRGHALHPGLRRPTWSSSAPTAWASTPSSAGSPAGSRRAAIGVGSLGGLAAARRGECDVAAIHLLDPKTGVYNAPFLSPGLGLVEGWRRMQGVVFRPGDARFAGRSATEAVAAALADPDCLMVNRNRGGGRAS